MSKPCSLIQFHTSNELNELQFSQISFVRFILKFFNDDDNNNNVR